MTEPTNRPGRAAEPSGHEEGITEAGRLGLGAKASAFVAGAEPEPLVYRPLSIWALAGFVLAVFYAVLVVCGGLAGLYFGSPLLLGTWGFVLPILSGAVAFVGRQRVARSEGTRAGLKLAVWGWWLSVLFGFSYLAFYAATYFAVCQQADTFAQQWFGKMKQGEINAAFLQTMEPSVAQGVNPKDDHLMELRFNMQREMGPGQLTSFREHALPRLLQQGGPEAEVKALGVKEWEYRGGSYKVRRTYQINTLEGEYEYLLSLGGVESKAKEWEGRRWQVIWGESGIQKGSQSALAKRLDVLRQEARAFVASWTQLLVDGELDWAYLATLESAERERLRLRYPVTRLVLPAMAAGAEVMHLGVGPTLALLLPFFDAEVGRELYLPAGYLQFKNLALLDDKDFRADEDRTRTDVQEGIRNLFRAVRERRRANLFLTQEVAVNPLESWARPWELKNDRLILTPNVKLGFYRRYSSDVVVVIESDPGAIQEQHKPTWRVLRLEAKRGEDTTKAARMPPGAGP